jgi:Kef-type K+ transport system membrane component KefB
MENTILQAFFLIFFGAAILASIALYTRQPLLVAYIAIGIILGPYGLSVMSDISQISEMSNIGIIFLLFLLGLDMQPASLFSVLKKVAGVVLISSVIFATIGFGLGILLKLTVIEAAILGIASMFSSTIIGIKLLPTTVLHHKRTGELMIGMLLLQDFLAIFCLLILLSGGDGELAILPALKTLITLPLLGLASWLFVKYALMALITKFDRFHEYIFLLAIGWCLGVAEGAELIGLSAEIGAFIAGISIATSPIAQYIALSLRPLRDFFLVLFFFSMGAQLNLPLLPQVAIAALVYSLILLTVKPLIFYFLFRKSSEQKSLAWDLGFRLGQISEFSLLIVFVATTQGIIGESASLLIQFAAIFSFVVSSYLVVLNFPTPIAISDRLRRD